ncbi:MAG: DUF1697 domain-containing protein [Erysipelotrichaceae bacterium]
MKRYIALLRGINISGKNKIAMADLKSEFIKLGFNNVLTHLNSGNVAFSVTDEDSIILTKKIELMIQEQFNLDIPVFLISQEKLQAILSNAPSWWGSDHKEIYDNLIFVMANSTAEIIAEKIGEPTKEIEQVYIFNNVIFWSFDKTKYAKANWWKKTASKGIGETITIRTANTLKKLSII